MKYDHSKDRGVILLLLSEYIKKLVSKRVEDIDNKGRESKETEEKNIANTA